MFRSFQETFQLFNEKIEASPMAKVFAPAVVPDPEPLESVDDSDEPPTIRGFVEKSHPELYEEMIRNGFDPDTMTPQNELDEEYFSLAIKLYNKEVFNVDTDETLKSTARKFSPVGGKIERRCFSDIGSGRTVVGVDSAAGQRSISFFTDFNPEDLLKNYKPSSFKLSADIERSSVHSGLVCESNKLVEPQLQENVEVKEENMGNEVSSNYYNNTEIDESQFEPKELPRNVTECMEEEEFEDGSSSVYSERSFDQVDAVADKSNLLPMPEMTSNFGNCFDSQDSICVTDKSDSASQILEVVKNNTKSNTNAVSEEHDEDSGYFGVQQTNRLHFWLKPEHRESWVWKKRIVSTEEDLKQQQGECDEGSRHPHMRSLRKLTRDIERLNYKTASKLEDINLSTKRSFKKFETHIKHNVNHAIETYEKYKPEPRKPKYQKPKHKKPPSSFGTWMKTKLHIYKAQHPPDYVPMKERFKTRLNGALGVLEDLKDKAFHQDDYLDELENMRAKPTPQPQPVNPILNAIESYCSMYPEDSFDEYPDETIESIKIQSHKPSWLSGDAAVIDCDSIEFRKFQKDLLYRRMLEDEQKSVYWNRWIPRRNNEEQWFCQNWFRFKSRPCKTVEAIMEEAIESDGSKWKPAFRGKMVFPKRHLLLLWQNREFDDELIHDYIYKYCKPHWDYKLRRKIAKLKLEDYVYEKCAPKAIYLGLHNDQLKKLRNDYVDHEYVHKLFNEMTLKDIDALYPNILEKTGDIIKLMQDSGILQQINERVMTIMNESLPANLQSSPNSYSKSWLAIDEMDEIIIKRMNANPMIRV